MGALAAMGWHEENRCLGYELRWVLCHANCTYPQGSPCRCGGSRGWVSLYVWSRMARGCEPYGVSIRVRLISLNSIFQPCSRADCNQFQSHTSPRPQIQLWRRREDENRLQVPLLPSRKRNYRPAFLPPSSHPCESTHFRPIFVSR